MCPCGLPQPYADCCGRFHSGAAGNNAASSLHGGPPTAELLMRSRYAAFAVGDEAYLRASWDPATCPRQIGLDPTTRWTGLQIVGRTGGGLMEQWGTVEFRAQHTGGTVAENSAFRRVGGRWVYVGPAS